MLTTLLRRIRTGQLLPYRLTYLGGLLNTVLLVHVRRPLLRLQAARAAARGSADITVLIGHRNRPDYRLVNALRSISAQQYDSGRVQVVVIDYGSAPERRAELHRITDELGATCLAVDGVDGWNRAHCLNIGIRRARTRYLMVTDVDVILSPTYLQEAVARLQADPLGMVLTPCLHLPEEAAPLLVAAAARGVAVDTEALRPKGMVKTAAGYSTGMVVARTEHFQGIRGFDEHYREYGSEDVDLVRRFEWLGLRKIVLSGAPCYLHQWHPRHEGVRSHELQARIVANASYLERNRTIKRNPAGWGEAVLAREEA